MIECAWNGIKYEFDENKGLNKNALELIFELDKKYKLDEEEKYKFYLSIKRRP